jgi:hypothetical protein
MTPVRPVVPVLRSPGSRGADHEVRVDGQPCCGARVDPDTWVVVAKYQTRNPCGSCSGERE